MNQLLISSLCFIFGCALWLLHCVDGWGGSPTPDDKVLDEIRGAWRSRQNRVRSARFQWTQKVTFAKGSESWLLDGQIEKKSTKETTEIPPTDITFEVPRSLSLSFSGRKVRYAHEGKSWSLKENGFVEDPYLSTFDGRQAKILHLPGGISSYPQGSIRPQQEMQHPDIKSVNLQPILLTYRALEPGMSGYPIDKIRFKGQRALHDGADCLLLDVEKRSSRSTQTLWVDPKRDYLVVRIVHMLDGAIKQRTDIQFGSNKKHGWIPQSWTIVIQNVKGKLTQSSENQVTSWEINPGIPSSEFDIEYPARSVVVDMSQRPEKRFVVKHDGSIRPVLPSEYSATHEQVISSEPGEALQPSPRDWSAYNWLFLVLIVIGAVLIFFGILRKRFRSVA